MSKPNKVWQEIFCTVSGGGCGGFILVKLNIALKKHRVKMICPKCKHEHFRIIDDGLVTEQGRFATNKFEEICPPISAWSKEPRTSAMIDVVERRVGNERDGVPVKELELSGEQIQAQSIIRQSWGERFLGKLVGK
jgi:hypothetical protein